MSTTWKEGPETFAEWKAAAQLHAEQLGLPPDLWTEADDYDLAEIAAEAFANRQDPKAFIEEAFDEDLARMQHDSEQWAESLFEEEGEE